MSVLLSIAFKAYPQWWTGIGKIRTLKGNHGHRCGF